MILAALLLAACGSSETPAPTAEPAQPQPTATPEAAPVPTNTPTPPPISDNIWERVRESGQLIVGTSADYPPFEFYNDNFQLDGFDIALIKEIGQILGVEVVIKDIAFDGLSGALQVDQIDAAIAAISVTPEREQVIDFSNVYYVGADAIIAADPSNVGEIGAVQDLAPYRVGVQKGSVYEDWLEDNLITTGLMPVTNLFIYSDTSQAVDDLMEGRVDVLVADLKPAKLLVEEGGFKLLAQELNRQRFAIAIPKGQPDLRAQINSALQALQDRGRIAELVEQYLNIKPEDQEPVPTPTPEPPTPTPAPAQPTATPAPTRCVDGMAWVADLTYDDHGMAAPPVLSPGQPFQKGWRVRNSGTCVWDSSYALTYLQGNQQGARMGGQPVAIQGQVQPGQTYDLFVDLVAPLTPGGYQGIWQMRNGEGIAFGERVWVGIIVPGAPTPTPMPTPPPSPDINFSVDRTQINAGECVNFRWDVRNVQAVFFFRDGQNWQDNGQAGQGGRQECPGQTTNYYLRVEKRDGSVETRQITINVQQNQQAPQIARFTVDPGQINIGQCVNIQWDVQGSVNRVAISRNGGPIWDGAPFRGNMQDCPPGTGTMNYVLDAWGPGGANRASVNITVNTQQPTPTPPPAEPIIYGLSVNPPQIPLGQCTTVSWSTGGGTERIMLMRNGAVVVDGGPLTGSTQDCPGDLGQILYELVASSHTGSNVSQTAALQVVEGPMPR